MNRKHSLILILALLTSDVPAFSQYVEPVLVSITYKFVYVNDVNKRNEPVTTLMVLHVGKQNSRYNNAILENENKDMQRKAAAAAANPTPVSGRVVAGRPATTVNSPGMSEEKMYQLPLENKILHRATLGMQAYDMEMPLIKIDWQIADGNREIGGYKCQKATGVFAGRTYTAWFTTDLPFRYGPWKLSGLPGLILEAVDSKNEVSFLFREIVKGEPGEQVYAGLPRRASKISEETFEKAKKMFDNDPVGSMQTQMSQINGSPMQLITFYKDATGKILYGDEAKAAIEKDSKIKYNNPIELTKPR
jgi:GLPGLI family protein